MENNNSIEKIECLECGFIGFENELDERIGYPDDGPPDIIKTQCCPKCLSFAYEYISQ